ncbi:MAG: XRE family transcriptional regulator [Clostridia bacterium]|nr:XRE family transcriptional regulator [Clostridia bacterium]
MVFNDRVKELRISHKLTQVQVAAGIGLTDRNYQRYETDGPVPNYKMLLALADFYNVSVDYLMGRTDKKEVNS